MTLHQQYTAAFERAWSIYPRWPVGRSKKHDGFLAWERANRILKFTEADVDAICRDIEERIKTCVTWQPGNKFGPPMFSTYCNKRLWAEPYEKKGRDLHSLKYGQTQEDGPRTPEQRAQADAARDRALAEMRRAGILRH